MVQTPSDPKASAQGGQRPVQFTILSLVNILWRQLLYKGQEKRKKPRDYSIPFPFTLNP